MGISITQQSVNDLWKQIAQGKLTKTDLKNFIYYYSKARIDTELKYGVKMNKYELAGNVENLNLIGKNGEKLRISTPQEVINSLINPLKQNLANEKNDEEKEKKFFEYFDFLKEVNTEIEAFSLEEQCKKSNVSAELEEVKNRVNITKENILKEYSDFDVEMGFEMRLATQKGYDLAFEQTKKAISRYKLPIKLKYQENSKSQIEEEIVEMNDEYVEKLDRERKEKSNINELIDKLMLDNSSKLLKKYPLLKYEYDENGKRKNINTLYKEMKDYNASIEKNKTTNEYTKPQLKAQVMDLYIDIFDTELENANIFQKRKIKEIFKEISEEMQQNRKDNNDNKKELDIDYKKATDKSNITTKTKNEKKVISTTGMSSGLTNKLINLVKAMQYKEEKEKQENQSKDNENASNSKVNEGKDNNIVDKKETETNNKEENKDHPEKTKVDEKEKDETEKNITEKEIEDKEEQDEKKEKEEKDKTEDKNNLDNHSNENRTVYVHTSEGEEYEIEISDDKKEENLSDVENILKDLQNDKNFISDVAQTYIDIKNKTKRIKYMSGEISKEESKIKISKEEVEDIVNKVVDSSKMEDLVNRKFELDNLINSQQVKERLLKDINSVKEKLEKTENEMREKGGNYIGK